jgi:protocatechuate 3,4-dioxygenase beta subunit
MSVVTRRGRTLIVATAAIAALFIAATHAQVVSVRGLASGQGPVRPGAEEPPRGRGLMVGQVVDATTKEPVPGVIVTVLGGPTILASRGLAPAGAGQRGAPPEPEAPRQVLTDESGRFMFRDLAAGRYSLRAMSPGYLTGSYGQTRPGGSSQTLELAEDEKRGDVVVRMWRTATLTGTVVDEAGEPVVGQTVRVLRRTVVGGRPRFVLSPTAQTDDRGAFRFANLMPGDYVVGAIFVSNTMPASTAEAYYQNIMAGGRSLDSPVYRALSSSGAPSATGRGYRVGEFIFTPGTSTVLGAGAAPAPASEDTVLIYPTTFYPSARSISQATVMTLTAGEDRTAINLQIRLMPTVRVSGTLMGPDGPVANTGVKLLPHEGDTTAIDLDLEAAATATDASGTFTFLGVTPGPYLLKVLRVPRPASPSRGAITTIEIAGGGGGIIGISTSGPISGPAPPLPTEPTLWATQLVTVPDSGLSGLPVTLRTGARISGRLVFEGASPQPSAEAVEATMIRIMAAAGSSPVGLSSPALRVDRDGTFSSVGFPPGNYVVSAVMRPVGTIPAPGSVAPVVWRYKSATAAGRDVDDEGLDVAGPDITLVITMTDRPPTSVSGTVTDFGSQADASLFVVVFPADSQAWQRGMLSGRRIRSARVSSTGTFTVSDLPPGAYYLAAIPEETLEHWQDPKVMTAIARVATRITLEAGSKTSYSLTTKVIR